MKRKTPRKKAATTATTPKRRRRVSASAVTKRTTRTRRRPRKKGMAEGLAEELDFSKKGSSLNQAIGSVGGALGYRALTKNVVLRKDRAIYGIVAGLACFAIGQPSLGVGCIGAAAYDYVTSPADAMGEGEVQYVDPSLLSDGEPAFLDAQGFPILREAYNFYGG